jgi:hypothetical protein
LSHEVSFSIRHCRPRVPAPKKITQPTSRFPRRMR